MKLPTLHQVEVALGEKASAWAGRCYEISCAIVDAKLCDGVAVYGHWIGRIAPHAFFAARRGPFVQHGWILLPDQRVLDPTRWAFDGRAPYLFVGQPGNDYDEGGNKWRTAMIGPPPPFRAADPRPALQLRPRVRLFVKRLLGEPPHITTPMVVWLANCTPTTLGPYAAELYQVFADIGRLALVPLDNLRMVERQLGRPIVDKDDPPTPHTRRP